jgi:hypothetical protein
VPEPVVSVRPRRLGTVTRLSIAAVALGGLIAVVAVARAARTEPDIAPAAVAPAEPATTEPDDDPAWTLSVEPVERVGYRQGRRHVFEVVPLGPSGVEVEVGTARAFLELRRAAAQAGVELGLASGFRTVEEQRALFRAWRKGRGNKAARPGRSNHQSGRALDIAGITAPGALAWLEANAASFGFQRTVRNEPWHWEYVDSPIARGAPPKRVARKSLKTAKMGRPARRPSAGTAPRHRVVASSPR